MTANPIPLPVRADAVTLPAPMVRMLGPFDAPGRSVPTAAKTRQILALMLWNANRFVSMAEFTDELWTHPPRCSDQSVQTYVMRLRHEHVGWDIATVASGYVLRLAPARVDVHVFDELVDRGRRSLTAGDVVAADRALRGALELWRGDPLANVTQGELLSGLAAAATDRYLTAVELRVDVDLRLGRHREVVDELAGVARRYPGREDLTAKLMVALYRSNRRVDALAAYRWLRMVLLEEHGLEPCSDLRVLHQRVLSGDPGLSLQGGGAA